MVDICNQKCNLWFQMCKNVFLKPKLDPYIIVYFMTLIVRYINVLPLFAVVSFEQFRQTNVFNLSTNRWPKKKTKEI